MWLVGLHQPRPHWAGDNDGVNGVEGDSLLGLSPPQLLLVLPFLGCTTSDLWILNFSRISLLHVWVCMSKVLQCCWQNYGPSYLSVVLYIDPFRGALYQHSWWLTQRKALQNHITSLFYQSVLWSNNFISENKPNSQISGMIFTQTFSLPSATTQKLSAKTF